MIKKRFREFFTYTKKERDGIIVLLFILIILILLRTYQSNKSYGEIVLLDKDFKKDIEEFEKSLTTKQIKNEESKILVFNSKSDNNKEWNTPNELFNFDPNKVSKNELKKLGFSEKQINTLINYREKGGRFFKKEDLLKVYGIENEQFKILNSFISIEPETKFEVKEVVENAENKLIELNTASKENLMNLNGIGSSYAERIIKYRDLLGGYYKKEQLLDVYGMDSSRYIGFINDILIDTNQLKKINLNAVDFKTLIRHPYLNKYQTESILKFRELEGKFSEIEQIYKNRLLVEEEFLRLKPYLKLK